MQQVRSNTYIVALEIKHSFEIPWTVLEDGFEAHGCKTLGVEHLSYMKCIFIFHLIFV